MKEFFENRLLTGDIKITCKFEDGTVRIWKDRKEAVVQHIIDIVDEYAAEGYVLTLRQLHYQFVKSNWIVNHDSAYSKLGDILDDCKYTGVIDWNNIEDRGRKPYLPYHVKDVEDALNDTIEQYRIDRQDGQDVHIELWSEKDALSAILQRSTEKYHIQLVINKGYTSSSAIYSAYKRFVNHISKGKRVVVLYFGDHDPSGLDMVRDIRDRVELMLRNGIHFEELFQYRDIPSAYRDLCLWRGIVIYEMRQERSLQHKFGKDNQSKGMFYDSRTCTCGHRMYSNLKGDVWCSNIYHPY